MALILNWGDSSLLSPVDGIWNIFIIHSWVVFLAYYLISALVSEQLSILVFRPVTHSVEILSVGSILGVVLDMVVVLREDLVSVEEFGLCCVGSSVF